MTRIEKCALCASRAKLSKSHVIPKFAIDWNKRTSATGYMRQGIKPNLRKQDIGTLKLLCAPCESRFSKWEKKFAEGIFIPLQERNQQSFKYGAWLLLFAVSLAWRTVIKEIEILRKRNPELGPFVENALSCWSTFLLGDNADPGPYDHHIFFLDFIAETQHIELPDKIQWYLLRGFDSTIASSSKKVFAYTKLPGLIFWSGIEPPKPEGWEKTLISYSGVMETPQRVKQPGFGEFVLDRAKFGLKTMSNMSERQRERIAQFALKNPERVVSSQSFQIYLAERFRQQQKKK